MTEKISNIIDLLEKISNKEFQECVWINQEYWNRAESFGETVNLLDDYHFFDDIETNKITMSKLEIQELIVSFAIRLLNFEEPSNIDELHKDTNWLGLMRDAEILKKEFLLNNYKNLD